MEDEAGAASLVVFGGTFDPLHLGHLVVAQDAWEVLRPDRFLFVPAATAPHKSGEGSAPAALRLRMAEAALAEDPRFEASPIEVERGGTSYTVETLRALRAAGWGGRIHLLLGADQYHDLPRWKEPAAIAELSEIAVMEREGDRPVSPPDGLELRVTNVPVTRVDLSSTAVRGRVHDGRPIRYLVPPSVARIIEEEGLYARGRRSSSGPHPDRPESPGIRVPSAST